MTDYITVAQFRARIGKTQAIDDVTIAEHVAAASRRIDAYCHRSFGPHDGAATIRYFVPLDCQTVIIDDTYDITAVAYDTADNGTYTTTWAASDYETEPANGIGANGQSGWPTTMLHAVSSSVELPAWPWRNRRRSVKVTAKWGWSAIPADVVEACYLLTNRLRFEVSVPGGVLQPNIDAGIPGRALARPYTAESLLMPYVRADAAIGIAG